MTSSKDNFNETQEDNISKITNSFIEKKIQERNNRLNISCANIINAFQNCGLELIKHMADKDTKTEKTKEFAAEITLGIGDTSTLEDCEKFMNLDRFERRGVNQKKNHWKHTNIDSSKKVVFVGFLPTHDQQPFVTIELKQALPKIQQKQLSHLRNLRNL